jgi:hypothetical protein
MELSGCVESLFVREHAAFDERIRACAAAGLEAVEFWQWRDKDLDKIERALVDTGLRLTLFSSEPRSPIVDPGTQRAFIAGLRGSVDAARRLKAHALCVLVDDRGVGAPTSEPRPISRQAQHEAIVAALKQAAPIAADAGIMLLVEPLNSKLDHKGIFPRPHARGPRHHRGGRPPGNSAPLRHVSLEDDGRSVRCRARRSRPTGRPCARRRRARPARAGKRLGRLAGGHGDACGGGLSRRDRTRVLAERGDG